MQVWCLCSTTPTVITKTKSGSVFWSQWQRRYQRCLFQQFTPHQRRHWEKLGRGINSNVKMHHRKSLLREPLHQHQHPRFRGWSPIVLWPARRVWVRAKEDEEQHTVKLAPTKVWGCTARRAIVWVWDTYIEVEIRRTAEVWLPENAEQKLRPINTNAQTTRPRLDHAPQLQIFIWRHSLVYKHHHHHGKSSPTSQSPFLLS